MAEYQPLLTQIAVIIGAVLLCVLSIGELNRDLRKSKDRFRYWTAVVVFLFVNLSVYLLLTFVSFGESPLKIAIGAIEVQGEGSQALRPLLIALFYFGAGAGTFKLGGKDFHLYKSLLHALEAMFRTRLISIDQLEYSDFRQTEVLEELKTKAEDVRDAAHEKGWDKLESQWKEFQEDEQFFRDELNCLRALQDSVQAVENRQNLDASLRKELENISAEIFADIERLTTSIIKKLQRYLVNFAFKNYKDEAELENFLIKIKVDLKSVPVPPNCWARALVIGFVSGLLAGPVFGLIVGHDPLLYAWIGSFSIMVFMGFVVAGINARTVIGSMIFGAVGGYFSHVIWLLLTQLASGVFWFSDSAQAEIGTDAKSLLFKAIIGLSFGVATALVTHLLRAKGMSNLATFGHHISISRPFSAHAVLTVSGALLYPLLLAGFYQGAVTIPYLAVSSVLGIIIMNAAGIAVDIGHDNKKEQKVRQSLHAPV